MRVFFCFIALLLTGFATSAQETDPASWKFSAKKVGDRTYDIQLVASLRSGWHLYSQTQPKGAIAYPAKIQFTNNPLVTRQGATKEVGKLQKVYDAATKSTAHQYGGTISFVQRVQLKASAKTSISGTVEYQTCDDEKCLRPTKVSFNIPVS